MYGTASSDEKLARMKPLGLEHGINYKEHDYQEAVLELTHGEGVDAVFEMLGGEHTAKSIRCLRDFGRVIAYGTATGHPAALDARALYAKGASVHGLWLTYLSGKRALMDEAWKRLAAWTSQGHLHPVVGSVMAMERGSSRLPVAARAQELWQSGLEDRALTLHHRRERSEARSLTLCQEEVGSPSRDRELRIAVSAFLESSSGQLAPTWSRQPSTKTITICCFNQRHKALLTIRCGQRPTGLLAAGKAEWNFLAAPAYYL